VTNKDCLLERKPTKARARKTDNSYDDRMKGVTCDYEDQPELIKAGTNHLVYTGLTAMRGLALFTASIVT
jgi:hypothetical protein